MGSESGERGRWGRRLETLLLSVLLLGIIGLAGLQILLRNVFSSAIYWADDLIRIAVLWIAVIGGMAASREGRHIAIGIVPRYCPKSWHKPSSLAVTAFAAVVTGLLAWHACRFVADSYRFGDTVLGSVPAWIVQAIMPLGFGVMSYRFLAQLVTLMRGRQ